MKPRVSITKMAPYIPGKPIDEVRRELGLEKIVKLASNENPLGPSPKAIVAMQEAAKSVHLYPDANCFQLKQAVASRLGLGPEFLVFGNGSDEIIHLLGLMFLSSVSDEVIVADPSFSRYDACAELVPCKLVKVPLTDDFRHDLPAMKAAVTANTKLLFVANPNNPTGTIVSKREFDALLDGLPEHVAVILDEAYFEFAEDEADYPNSVDYVKEGRPVIGLRTFSKTYGLAGVRVGYAVASPDLIDAFNRVREPFNVNSISQAAAIAALTDQDHLEATKKVNRDGIGQLTAALTKHGAKVGPSFANFVFADMGRPSKPIFEALLKKGVIVRGGDQFGTPTCLRISVGTAEENAAFAAALDEVLG